MSIEQAVDLVLYALENGQDKDLWVYNNKACTIKELADCISENQVEVGLRCVEKNDEALLTVNELNHSELFYNEYFRVSKEIEQPTCYWKKDNIESLIFKELFTEPFRSDNAGRFTKEELMELISEI